MSLANLVGLVGFARNKNEFKEFFDGGGNILNTSLTFLFIILLPSFAIYYHVKIHRIQNRLKEEPWLKDKFANFFTALHGRDVYSSVYCIMFLYRRILSALCLVFWSSYPYFQIQALLVLALTTMWYIGFHTPYHET